FEEFALKVRTALVNAFVKIGERFIVEFSEDKSGTTMTVTLLCGRLLTVANVGDADTVVDTGTDAFLATVNHSIQSNEAERKRLVAAGVLLAAMSEDIAGPAKPGEQGLGPVRCWPGGLKVSRSIGDVEAGEHVLPCPHICQITLPKSGARLLMGSSGLWDLIHWRKATQITRRTAINAAASKVVDTALLLNKGTVHLDTSAVVIDAMSQSWVEFPVLVKHKATEMRSKYLCGLPVCQFRPKRMGPCFLEEPGDGPQIVAQIDGRLLVKMSGSQSLKDSFSSLTEITRAFDGPGGSPGHSRGPPDQGAGRRSAGYSLSERKGASARRESQEGLKRAFSQSENGMKRAFSQPENGLKRAFSQGEGGLDSRQALHKRRASGCAEASKPRPRRFQPLDSMPASAEGGCSSRGEGEGSAWPDGSTSRSGGWRRVEEEACALGLKRSASARGPIDAAPAWALGPPPAQVMQSCDSGQLAERMSALWLHSSAEAVGPAGAGWAPAGPICGPAGPQPGPDYRPAGPGPNLPLAVDPRTLASAEAPGPCRPSSALTLLNPALTPLTTAFAALTPVEDSGPAGRTVPFTMACADMDEARGEWSGGPPGPGDQSWARGPGSRQTFRELLLRGSDPLGGDGGCRSSQGARCASGWMAWDGGPAGLAPMGPGARWSSRTSFAEENRREGETGSRLANSQH
ncbi:unnamed protein product, partial [Ostreobium quekettii]